VGDSRSIRAMPREPSHPTVRATVFVGRCPSAIALCNSHREEEERQPRSSGLGASSVAMRPQRGSIAHGPAVPERVGESSLPMHAPRRVVIDDVLDLSRPGILS